MNAFGILVSRFRVMITTIELPPETVRDVVLTCVVLHNILRSQYQGQHGGQQPGGDDDDDDVPGDGRLIGGAADCGHDRNPAREAKRLRDYLKDHFNNEGAVAWQDDRIFFFVPNNPTITTHKSPNEQTDKPNAQHNSHK